uniref:Uncharacterized protein n=1 Tax=Strigamia maritima TaxID=126957 RepID=T1JKR7_STRMM
TASDLSDIEGRVHALKEELRRRKFEADRLRKEQKRRNKERLKAQEASLLKQIEAYDRFISQAKTDLDHELEVDTLVKVTKPQIRQPKVAESRHLVKIQNSSSIQGWSEGAGDELANSPKDTPRDDTIASSLSDLTMNESNKSSSFEEDKSSHLLETVKRTEHEVDVKATESEASSSDSVKTVTEKTEDLIQPQSGTDGSKAAEQSQVLLQPEIKLSTKDDEITKEKMIKVPERSASDDETIAEEIVDEEVEVVVSEATRVPRDDKIEIVGHSSMIPPNTEGQVSNANDSVSPVIHTSSASSSSTFQDRKKNIDNVIKKKIEALISSLIQKELDNAVEEVREKLKKRKKCEESNVFCNVMSEELLKFLYDTNFNLILAAYKRNRRPSSPISVGHRVRAIMTELEQKSTISSPQDRPSLNDILSLSSPNAYNDVLTSPEGSASLSESPARAEGLESPTSRPLSPVPSYSNDRFQVT